MKGMISMMKLPLDVRQDFVDRTGQDLPKACARALADIEGNLGEAFAACDDEALFIYSKKLNEEWRQLVMPFNTIAHMALEDDRPFVYLKAKTSDGNELSLKFGSMDEDVLSTILKTWDNTEKSAEALEGVPLQSSRVDDADEGEPVELDAFTAFTAVLYAMMEVDGSVDPEERHQLNRLVGHPGLVARAIKALRSQGFDAIKAKLPDLLDDGQKFCLACNLAELAMVDGYLRGSEKELYEAVIDTLGIAKEDSNLIYRILTCKNNMSVFSYD